MCVVVVQRGSAGFNRVRTISRLDQRKDAGPDGVWAVWPRSNYCCQTWISYCKYECAVANCAGFRAAPQRIVRYSGRFLGMFESCVAHSIGLIPTASPIKGRPPDSFRRIVPIDLQAKCNQSEKPPGLFGRFLSLKLQAKTSEATKSRPVHPSGYVPINLVTRSSSDRPDRCCGVWMA